MGSTQRVIVVACILASALTCPDDAAAQVFNPVLIKGVPDWNQPNHYQPAPDSFQQPPNGIPDRPPAAGGVAEWCTPTAAANVMGWFEDRQGATFQGLADGRKAPLRQQPYPNNDTSGAGNPDGLPDWQQNKWMDGVIELGYRMDTQGWLTNNANQSGTSTAMAPVGIKNFAEAELTNTRWASWNAANLNIGASWNDYLRSNWFRQNGVACGDPVLVHWDVWLDTDAAHASGLPYTRGGIDFYTWDYTVSGIGHTVTGVGFWSGDPDGAANPMPNANWCICADNWASTNPNPNDLPNGGLVAVPWSFTDDQGNAVSLWKANTHIRYVGPNFKMSVEPDLGFGHGVSSTRGLSSPNTQWVAERWTCESGLPITGLHWWGVELEPAAVLGDWTFRVLEDSDDDGLPDTEMWSWVAPDDAVFTSPTGQQDSQGREILDYFIDLPGGKWVFQKRGNLYWLQIDRESQTVPDAWGWLTGLGSSEHWWTADGITWVLEPTYDLAFELQEFVPEPASLLLLGSGAALLGRRRKRR